MLDKTIIEEWIMPLLDDMSWGERQRRQWLMFFTQSSIVSKPDANGNICLHKNGTHMVNHFAASWQYRYRHDTLKPYSLCVVYLHPNA